MKVALIAAVADNGVIGQGNDLPWRLSEDLQRFKRLTMGHHLLMGRKTFESVGRALPGRTTIVISRGRPDLPEGVLLAPSLEQALEKARVGGEDLAFVAGGGEIYRLALAGADRLFLTRVRTQADGDVTFPEVDWSRWTLVERQEHPLGESTPLAFDFEDYERS